MSKPDSPQLLWVEHQAAQQIGKKLLIGGQQGCAHITLRASGRTRSKRWLSLMA
jgi:hypothetical protein